MLWVVEVAVALFFGYQFVSRFVGNGCAVVERGAIGIVVGLFALAWLAFLSSVRRVVGPMDGVVWSDVEGWECEDEAVCEGEDVGVAGVCVCGDECGSYGDSVGIDVVFE